MGTIKGSPSVSSLCLFFFPFSYGSFRCSFYTSQGCCHSYIWRWWSRIEEAYLRGCWAKLGWATSTCCLSQPRTHTHQAIFILGNFTHEFHPKKTNGETEKYRGGARAQASKLYKHHAAAWVFIVRYHHIPYIHFRIIMCTHTHTRTAVF